MDIDAMLDMAKDILPDAPEFIGSLSEILPEPSQKLLAMALKLLFASIGTAREERDKNALATAGRDTAEQVPAETAEELRAFCRQFQEDGPIIPPECRKRYLETILEKYSDFPYKSQLYNAFSVCVSRLEEAMRRNYSAGELGITRQVMLTRTDMDEIKRVLAELLDQSRPKQEFATSNQDYKEIFEAPLFLHRGNERVCLRNLFVPYRFKVAERVEVGQMKMWRPYESMDNYLAWFVRDEETQFLFIEGDAGCGKSSLTAYLSWHYERHDTTATEIFGDAHLVTVRLRNIDVPTSGRTDERLTLGVLRFLYGDKEPDKEIIKRFRAGVHVLLLDGYDELCTTDGIENPEAVLGTLKNLNCKIIVTTRPNYIRFQHFEKDYWHIALEHFNGTQRREWLRRYQNCGQTLNEVNRQYLERIGDDKTEGICDTPMGLYMVAAGRFKPDMLKNEWAVYRRIFYRELSETEYNQIFQDVSAQHSVREYQDLLYRVSEEIAWYLYQRNNENLLVPGDEITRIIGELELNEDKRKIVERCFALCGYWKANTGRGCVEFYHNNIRDFFLCEKLMRELNDAYREHEEALRNKYGNITSFLQHLCELFQYGKLEKTVLFFIKQRAAYFDKEPDLCVDTEQKERHTARIFETMLLDGDCYSICDERRKCENPVRRIAHILSNTVAVYRFLYESFLKHREHIQWWTDVKAVNRDGTFRQLADEILECAGSSNLSNTNLRGADLRDVNLHGKNLGGADLGDADLGSADLHGADLRGADLRGADLRGTDLHGADLRDVNLQNAKLSSADLGSANLHSADLHGMNLQKAKLNNADLGSADLHGTDLSGADLRNADLRDVNLHSANLQGANLQGANLQGANLGGADLRDVNLGGADLGGADLSGADLRDVNLHSADLHGMNLQKVKLNNADLSGANLQGANLGGANLGGANLGDANLHSANLGSMDLHSADLRNADLHGADLSNVDLRGVSLQSANLYGADLSNANLRGAGLSNSNLRSANLRNADFYGASLCDTYLRDANLQGANLHGVNLHGTNLSNTDLSNANLQGANLQGVNLYGANLYGADLRYIDLRNTNLRGADLRGTNLQGANFRDANLYGVHFDDANLQGAYFCGATGYNLKDAKGSPIND